MYSFIVGALTITVVVAVVYSFVQYCSGMWSREGFTKNTPYGCDPNLKRSPDSGCVPPTLCDGNCDQEVYIDINGHKFKKCYYDCGDPMKKCKYDMCCKAVYPPVYFRIDDATREHPSQVVHVPYVIHAGTDHHTQDTPSASSTQTTQPSQSTQGASLSATQPSQQPNSSTRIAPKPEFEPSSSHTNTQTNGDAKGTPMPEYEPGASYPATTSARFSDVSSREARERNKAFMEGNMKKADTPTRSSTQEPSPAEAKIDTHAYIDHTGIDNTPVGYSDPLIL